MSDQTTVPSSTIDFSEGDENVGRQIHPTAPAVSHSDQRANGEEMHARLPLHPLSERGANIDRSENDLPPGESSLLQGSVPLTRHDLVAETKSLQEALVRSLPHAGIVPAVSCVLGSIDQILHRPHICILAWNNESHALQLAVSLR